MSISKRDVKKNCYSRTREPAIEGYNLPISSDRRGFEASIIIESHGSG